MNRKKMVSGGLAALLAALCAINLAHDGRQTNLPLEPAPLPVTEVALASQSKRHEPITLELMAILEQNPGLIPLLQKSIALAKEANPDPQTNPAQSLEQYYAYLDGCVKALPWNVLSSAAYSTLFEQIDQSLTYFYFLLDQPLEELADSGLLAPCLQYVEALRPWLVKYAKDWGAFLSTPESWTQEYEALLRAEERFGLSKGWYEAPENWHSFNDFFARRLRNPQMRPIAFPEDPSLLTAPADSTPQGLWAITKAGEIVPRVQLKSTAFLSVAALLGQDSAYQEAFDGGSLTHTFLNVDDYHRFHFPLSGVIREAALIPGQDAVGGKVLWDSRQEKYVLQSQEPGWQTIETRARVIVETEEWGLVALMPIGMSQVNAILLEDSVQVGAQVQKGDMLGCFLFGGSDFVMIFQEGVQMSLLPALAQDGAYAHVLMGEPYARLTRK